ncbi:MAG: hypothetical protein Q9227_007781 [Pyrenula ochraceoflavens]
MYTLRAFYLLAAVLLAAPQLVVPHAISNHTSSSETSLIGGNDVGPALEKRRSCSTVDQKNCHQFECVEKAAKPVYTYDFDCRRQRMNRPPRMTYFQQMGDDIDPNRLYHQHERIICHNELRSVCAFVQYSVDPVPGKNITDLLAQLNTACWKDICGRIAIREGDTFDTGELKIDGVKDNGNCRGDCRFAEAPLNIFSQHVG